MVEGSLKQSYYSPPKDMNPVMMEGMFQKLVEENAMLWAEKQMTALVVNIQPMLLVDWDMGHVSQ